MKPIIGVLAEVYDDLHTQMPVAYASAIERSGGVPVVLPHVASDDAIDAFVALCDGFFFTGGVDVDPQRYGEEKSLCCGAVQEHRDTLEFAVFDKAFQTRKPILGICRGEQLINVALGGTLYQDITTELQTDIAHRQVEAKNDFSHSVSVFEDTPLHHLIGKQRMRANSFHHQAIKQLGTGLAVMAAADDGVVEAIYLKGERYLRAYQWHPERLYGADPHSCALFDDFIRACKSEV